MIRALVFASRSGSCASAIAACHDMPRATARKMSARARIVAAGFLCAALMRVMRAARMRVDSAKQRSMVARCYGARMACLRAAWSFLMHVIYFFTRFRGMLQRHCLAERIRAMLRLLPIARKA